MAPLIAAARILFCSLVNVQTSCLAWSIHSILGCLVIEAAAAGSPSATRDGVPASHPALPSQLAARLAAGQQRTAALMQRKRSWLIRNFAAEVQPAAAELAAALEQYWQLPELQAAAELDLAAAASARSCAYLRCANLGAEGGPAAGEGVGSSKCRWAGRVVRGAAAQSMKRARRACWIVAPTAARYGPPLALQCVPRGVVLRHRLLARRLAAGRAPPHVQGAGGCAAGSCGSAALRAVRMTAFHSAELL